MCPECIIHLSGSVRKDLNNDYFPQNFPENLAQHITMRFCSIYTSNKCFPELYAYFIAELSVWTLKVFLSCDFSKTLRSIRKPRIESAQELTLLNCCVFGLRKHLTTPWS